MQLEKALDWLKDAATDGAWGYLPQGTPRVEPTLHACAAGLPVPVGFLKSVDLDWGVLLAPAALSLSDGTESLREAWIRRVLTLSGTPLPKTEHLDGSLVGWSWFTNTFSWLEPTSYATVSLVRNGHDGHARVMEARALIRDRVCVDGGWNYGNKKVFGNDLLSYHHSTAWALLALPQGDSLVPQGIERLRKILQRPSTLSLSLATLAAGYHSIDPTPWVEALVARQADDGSFGNGRVDRTALAAGALRMMDTGLSPFTGMVSWNSEQGVENE